MNRYESSQKWRKVKAGWYESPDGRYCAWWNEPNWNLYAIVQNYEKQPLGTFLTLADCQEHADRLEGKRPEMSCDSCGKETNDGVSRDDGSRVCFTCDAEARDASV